LQVQADVLCIIVRATCLLTLKHTWPVCGRICHVVGDRDQTQRENSSYSCNTSKACNKYRNSTHCNDRQLYKNKAYSWILFAKYFKPEHIILFGFII